MTNTSLALMGVTILWLEPTAAWLLAIPIALDAARLSDADVRAGEEQEPRVPVRVDPHPSALAGAGRGRVGSSPARAHDVPRGTCPARAFSGRGPASCPGDGHRSRRGAPASCARSRLTRTTRCTGARWSRPRPSSTNAPRPTAKTSSSAIRACRTRWSRMLRGDAETIGMLVIGDRLGDVTSFVARGPEAVRDARQPCGGRVRERAAGPLAGTARRAQGAAAPSGVPRRPDRPRQPRPVPGAARRGARRASADGRIGRRSCSWTWTTSRQSTTRSATPPATSCLRRSAERLRACLRPTDTGRSAGRRRVRRARRGRRDGRRGRRSPSGSSKRSARRSTSTATKCSIHGSIGIAVSRRPQDGAEALVRDADVAMYTAKASGKGGYADLPAAVLRRGRSPPRAEGRPAASRR